MSVAIKVDSVASELGRSDFVHAFFSTISAHLEPRGWGTRFPTLMNELYRGRLAKGSAGRALFELRDAESGLAKRPPSDVVWDIDNPAARPPWGDDISPDITSLANYFVTSTGRDMFDTLEESIEYFRDDGSSCELVEI